MKTAIVLCTALALTEAVAQERSGPGSQPHGLTVGVRSGYAVPFGTSANSVNFSDSITGMIPIWGDLGYRFTPQFYFGGFFQYGFGLVPSTACISSASCSENDLRFGANLHYHFAPAEAFDPWIGVGGGYEIWNTKVSWSGQDFSASLKGFEFANAQVGLDFRGGPNFGVGPFAAFSIGQFSRSTGSLNPTSFPITIQKQGIHAWLIFGIRGAFDFSSE